MGVNDLRRREKQLWRGENYDLFTINMVLITFFSPLEEKRKMEKESFFAFFSVIFCSSLLSSRDFPFSSFCELLWEVCRIHHGCSAMFVSWRKSQILFWIFANLLRWRCEVTFCCHCMSRKVVYWWHFQWTFVECDFAAADAWILPSRITIEPGKYNDVTHT